MSGMVCLTSQISTGDFLYSNEVCTGKLSFKQGRGEVKSNHVLCAFPYVNRYMDQLL